MYIYQNGKLYVQDGDKVVGVEIHSHKVNRIAGTEDLISSDAIFLTPFEVQCKFHLDTTDYTFPVEKKEVDVIDTTSKVEKPIRKRSRK